MKIILTYYLLLLYTASLCKPFTIWLTDALAHVYFSHEHAIVHQHDGDEHVHYEIGKAAKDDTPAEKKSTQKGVEELSFCNAASFQLVTTSAEIKIRFPHLYKKLLSCLVEKHSPPPRSC